MYLRFLELTNHEETEGMNYRKFMVLPIAMIVMFAAAQVFAADVNELERRLNIVSEELDRMKGSGSAGGGHSKTSVHGYGETHFSAQPETDTKIDQHRFVIGVHSEITDWIHLNAEIDFEHAAQKLEFEFGQIDFLLSDGLNLRGGVMLMPMGNLNEFHEPNKFFTPERPDYHSKLIPTTWQQAGLGLFGAQGDISYRFYVVNALQALDETRSFQNDSFVRKGRSQINEISAGNAAVVGRVEKKQPGGQAGLSFYSGNSSGDYIDEGGNVTMLEFDYKTKRGAYDLDFGVFKGWIADSTELNAACDDGVSGTACDGDIPEEAFGLLATFAVHLPELMGKAVTYDLIPFVQYQKIKPQDAVGGGATDSPKANWDVLTIGASYMPHPHVAIKTAWRTNYYGGTEATGAAFGDAGTSGTYWDLALAYQY
jgi:hypothetical protein